MKLSDESLNALADIITGDKKKSPYQRGVDLVSFFNKLGFHDSYDQGFPTRWHYTKGNLDALNDFDDISKAVISILNPRRFLNTEYTQQIACDYLNPYFELDGYGIVVDGNTPRITGQNEISVEQVRLFEGSEVERHTFIREQQTKIEKKLTASDFDGAITNARSMLEAVLTSLDAELGNPAGTYDGDLPRLYKKVARQLGLDPSRPEIENALKQVLTGLISIVNGISSVSNKMGDRHARTYKPSKRHAQLVTDSTITVANFLFETWKSTDKN